MSKALVLGNGRMLVCLDACGQVRDFYFPYVGHENHVGHGSVHRIGISIDGDFHWLDDGAWECSVDYAPQTMRSHIMAVHRESGVSLTFLDVVCHDRDTFLRRVEMRNGASEARQVKLFFHQQFRIYDTPERDTGYYDPDRKIVVHYEGKRVFVIGGQCRGKGFDEYSIGNYGIEGKEGTWKDAEDGRLENNPVEHGEVDSVIAFALTLAPGADETAHYWVTAHRTHRGALDAHALVLAETPDRLIENTSRFWRRWVTPHQIDPACVPSAVARLFERSLIIIRTHMGENGGIIASADSDLLTFGRDTYAYVWPRDAAYTVLALDQAGDTLLTRAFFEFCRDVLDEEGYFLQKYRSDKTIGSSWLPSVAEGKKRLPIQEDETASVLFALGRHFDREGDPDFIRALYVPLIKQAADFLCRFRDETTGLPGASSDIWERTYGIATYTAAAVCGGLVAAGRCAEALGERVDAATYRQAAEEIKAAILRYLYDPARGYFHTSLEVKEGAVIRSSGADASAFFGMFLFGVLEAKDERMTRAFAFLERELTCPTPVGGLLRFTGDEYFRVRDDAPGNPWINVTLWGARYRIATAETATDLAPVYATLDWTVRHAAPSGILAEQLRSDTGAPVSAAPLLYGHAEVIATVLELQEKCRQFGKPA